MTAARFNAKLPLYLEKRIRELDLFLCESITYAYAFDYLMLRGYVISISKDYDLANECFSGAYDWSVDGSNTKDSDVGSYTDTWFEAANKAIESCIDLINKKTINNE